ncbi:MAG: argininosuccinate lyase, partial [Coriobacteriia bacterium]|nr:argininosuccinate lyase [Coriobacteriia bacterium]
MDAPSLDEQAFGASLPVDQRMWREDIAGSQAHARMLAAVGVLSVADAEAIVAGLEQIAARIEAGDFVFDIADEDIHMSIERALIEAIGEVGKRLHTGRSRNDQVATDTRLYLKRRTRGLLGQLVELESAFCELARSYSDVLLPGYTHLQKAQPILFAHHMLAYFWMFTRDFERLMSAWQAANRSPLGAAALAGTGYPLDRLATARDLGFTDAEGEPQAILNSLDAVSDRDYLLDALFACSTAMMHLSRLAEELVIWSTSEFGFITLSDQFATGSSIMPQKKNPDFAELVRAKTGRVYGDLVGLLTVLKALPLAYNKDLQEDKEGVFDALDTLEASLAIVCGMLLSLRVNAQRMQADATTGFLNATDLADYLTVKGMPFREAHRVVGELVLLAEQRGVELGDLALDELRAASGLFAEDVYVALDVATVVAQRATLGGTAPERVAEQLGQAEQVLAAQKMQ